MLIVLGIVSSIFLGCVEKPAGTPTPTAAPTVVPTVVPTTPPPMPTPVPSPASVTPAMYRVWIDSDYGFYMVRGVRGDSALNLSSDFKILNFTINVGDSVRWINDDSYDFPLTVASEEGLWTGRTGLMRWKGDRFEYTFNKTGTYTFYIEEYPRLEKQKITVKP